MQDSEDFTTLYANSRVMRVAAFFILFFGAALLAGYSSGDYLRGVDAASLDTLHSAIVFLSYFTVYMLWNSFVYERQSFYWSLPVGIAWGLLGDTLAIPFWMVTVSLILSLLTQFRSGLVWKSLLWVVAAYCYSDIYSFTPYLLFYGVCIAMLLAGWKVMSVRIARQKKAVSDKAVLSNRSDEAITSSFRAPSEEKFSSSYRPPTDTSPVTQAERASEPLRESHYRPPRERDDPQETKSGRKPATFDDLESNDYAGILTLLENKSATLPPALQNELTGLVRHGRLILQSMKDDPDDVKPGTAFLNRYMSAVIRVVEQTERQSLPDDAPSRSPVLDKCLTALQALHSAFVQQLAQLQENDQLKFDVEMNTLDSLLRMDGFK